MKVYIVQQEWQCPDEQNHNVVGVYDSREKAQEKMKSLYEEDLEWMKEINSDCEELDENEVQDNYTFVQFEEYWSENSIQEFELE
jgi:hypothetical protein